ncbi:MAG TPA: hypothetical protein VN734_16225 [Acidobacteriaceae bacterium]|nr:hypothetical protein [Acidobacteriaceae bacterium]
MKTLCKISVAALAAGLILSTPAMCLAQQQAKPSAPIRPESAEHMTAGPVTWTPEQLITASVHDAWLMSGKNQATFFEMVTQLAVLSAQKRGLQLPESEKAGERFGELIKQMAKADTDQLLYDVVDKAVKQVGVPLSSTAASGQHEQHQ